MRARHHRGPKSAPAVSFLSLPSPTSSFFFSRLFCFEKFSLRSLAYLWIVATFKPNFVRRRLLHASQPDTLGRPGPTQHIIHLSRQIFRYTLRTCVVYVHPARSSFIFPCLLQLFAFILLFSLLWLSRSTEPADRVSTGKEGDASVECRLD